MKKVFLIVGARPNFMKISPIIDEMKKCKDKFIPILVHTGQHYDYEMSKNFFDDLELPEPDIYLGVGSGTHAEQTAKVMLEFEKVCIKEKPNLIIVVGDVNSTLACAIVAAKLCIPLAHIEAGLRSFDKTMPEEINRKITDSLSDYLFTHCEDANNNLINEGISKEKIFFVGNVMIDTLIKSKIKIQKSKIIKKLNIKDYGLVTLHRPSNVDDKNTFLEIIHSLIEIGKHIQLIFPVHPRTQKQINLFNFNKYFLENSIIPIQPLGYIDFLALMMNAKFVLTDSGGIQEETTFLRIPCLTIRKNTERPITIYEGTNELVGTDKEKIVNTALNILTNGGKKGKIPKLWDGKSSKRIVEILK